MFKVKSNIFQCGMMICIQLKWIAKILMMSIRLVFDVCQIVIYKFYNKDCEDLIFDNKMANITLHSLLSKLREALSNEMLNRYKKNELIAVYRNLRMPQMTYRKAQLADIISVVIIEQVENQHKIMITHQNKQWKVYQELTKLIQTKLKDFGLGGISHKKIYDFFISETNSNDNYMAHRQPKTNHQTIDNIWNATDDALQCLCPKAPLNLQNHKKLQKCYRCNKQFHSECYWSPQKGQLFECPFCFIKHCHPNKQLKQIVFMGYIPILKKDKIQYKINFHIDSKIKFDKLVNVQVRCIKFNNKNKYQLSWPDSLSFYLGKIKIHQFKPLLANSPLKRRQDQPIKLDKNRLQLENQIVIEQKNTSQTGFKLNKKCYHLITIMAITELTNQDILHKFQNNTLSIKQSKAAIRDYMIHQSNDIKIQKIAISLRCQLYGSRIKLPARSKICTTHIQPFDLMNFIKASINAKLAVKKWKCPICDKRAYDLMIDQYILQLMNLNQSANEIIFNQNGEPQLIQGTDDSKSQDECKDYQQVKKQICKKQQIISLDQDDSIGIQKILINSHNSHNNQQLITNNHHNQILHLQKSSSQVNNQGPLFIPISLQKYEKQPNEQLKIPQIRNFDQNLQENLEEQQKKIRKLNNGIIETVQKQKKIDKIGQNINIIHIDNSDQQQISLNKLIESPLKKPLIQKKVTTVIDLKQKKINDKNQKQQLSDTLSNNQKQNNSQIKINQFNQKSINQQKLSNKLNNIQNKIQNNNNQQKTIQYIQIDDSDQSQNKINQQIQKQLTQKMIKHKKSMEKQGKVQIMEEDTQIFQEILNKIMEISQQQ